MVNLKKNITKRTSNHSKRVAIVIPFHKSTLSQDEKISAKHLNKFLGDYDKFIVLPVGIKKISFKIPKSKVINFPKQYFTGVPSYCELLNTAQFYQPFTNYDYILIYQLDVLVFSNQLQYWCNRGYDYIGAPLLNSKIGFLSNAKGISAPGCNGGFSLRKVDKFLRIISLFDKEAKRSSSNFRLRKLWFFLAVLGGRSHHKWLEAPASCYPFNEDGFWSFEAPKYDKSFKVAPWEEALKFSFEKNPSKCFKLNNYQLPFGCHAWAKYDRNFWQPHLST